MSIIEENGNSSLSDEELNLRFNRERWGRLENWTEKDNFGYQWGGGYKQKNGEISRLADEYLKPFLPSRYDLKVLELSPGGGRFSAELIRYADVYYFLDMNPVCLDICKERFKYYPAEMHFLCNNGRDCDILGAVKDFDLIACYDSMVHMHRDIAKNYLRQFASLAAPGGVIFVDHPGKGMRASGHRTDIYVEDVQAWAGEFGLRLLCQRFRNASGDCISILQR